MNINIKTEKNYTVEIEKHLIENMGLKMLRYTKLQKICIVTDVNVHSLYTKHLTDSLQNTGFEVHKIVFDSGESSKSFTNLERILNYLAEENFTKTDMLIALGGGVIGDLTGFAASVYLRGIEYIQMPTTLLAAVDSSVGGKTAVNLGAGKNLAGAFWQPAAVFFDTVTLETLPKAELQNGISEIIKAGIILDEGIFSILENTSPSDMGSFIEEVIARAITVKKNIVELDEREQGLRQTLNLGHTIGHAIEKASNYEISHGRAVAMGTYAIARIAEIKEWTKEDITPRLIELYNKYQFDLTCRFTAEEIASYALHDKKRKGDIITLAIPQAVGKCRLMDIKCDELISLLELVFERG
ncbi:MAG: 3-dehydroquinate synthase [Eubacterium sp.]|nr:3-dehydroquinate synthase [Eubacterium sp.]